VLVGAQGFPLHVLVVGFSDSITRVETTVLGEPCFVERRNR